MPGAKCQGLDSGQVFGNQSGIKLEPGDNPCQVGVGPGRAVAVKIGQRVRLSAEVLSVSDNVAEVSQVLLFLRTGQGRVPVWLLSTKAVGGSLNAARYLEMHVPATDYFIL